MSCLRDRHVQNNGEIIQPQKQENQISLLDTNISRSLRVRAREEKNTSRDLARLAAKFAAEKKGENIVLMNMAKISAVCDWFVVVSASSSRRIKAIADAIEKGLSQKKIHPLRIEGRTNPSWVLLDYNDLIVHVFYKEVRDFYGLERLWSDAPREKFDAKC